MGVKILEAEEYRNLGKSEAATRATPFQDELVEGFMDGLILAFALKTQN